MAQTTGNGDVDGLREEVERLKSEVEYLKENAKGTRKEAAVEAVAVENLKTTASKFTWSGDLRYRHEEIDTEGNVTNRDRDRLRVRFGVLAKVNDTISAKLQLSTTNVGGDNGRSTNQSLGNGTAGNGAWDRKTVGWDLAYVEWKALAPLAVQLGKTPMPWTRTNSYFWDGDLTPEGGNLKFSHGIFFANAAYNHLSEQDSGSNASLGIARSTDSKVVSAQLGVKLPIGKSALTAAVGYFDVQHVQDQPVTVAGTGCGTYAAANPAFGGSPYGNTTYTVTASAGNTCSQLLSDFNPAQALVQLDLMVGKFPLTIFADYMMNTEAEVNPVVGDKLDTAISGGFIFNKASAAKSWEAGVIYQKTEKDAIFGQFVDSDFGGGVTDVEGFAVKAAWVPATNWTINGTYFVNKRFVDIAAANGTITTAQFDHDYKRLQLDLNYKF